MKRCYLFICLLSTLSLRAQFAPQAGMPGSTALHKDDPGIFAWGDSVNIQRGWINAADTTLGKTYFGDETAVRGKADGMVLSLGDGGEALYYFANPIVNGTGFDFAVYENGFIHPENGHLAYLEFATVEVSSDGLLFVPFPALSVVDTLTQVAGTGEYMDCRQVDGVAGKYIALYGTPFDLDLLSGAAGLDLQQIHYVKIKDVVGSLNDAFCTRDAQQRKMNDPYPTDFPTGGFDLDGLAVLHTRFPSGLQHVGAQISSVYPNPVSDRLQVRQAEVCTRYSICTLNGMEVSNGTYDSNGIAVHSLASGTYVLTLQYKNGNKGTALFSKW